MILYFLSFFIGVGVLQCFSHLPNMAYLLGTIIIFIICGFVVRKYLKTFVVIISFISGMLWSDWYASELLSWRVPQDVINKPILITGRISSLPVTNKFGVRFDFELTSMNKAVVNNSKIRLRLSNNIIRDQSSLALSPGQYWQFVAKLKPIHAIQNPGTFDYEAWAIAHGLRAEGHIVSSKNNYLISDHWYHSPLNRARFSLKNKIKSLLPQSSTSAWLLALTIGEHENITAYDWEVLRKTGTNHLMAIAGLHIGLVALATQLVASVILKQFPNLFLYVPLRMLSIIPAVLIAFIYSALAGFSLPTKRACVMLFIATFAFFLRRKVSQCHILCFSLFIILLISPLDILTDSFWLSFSTIALIIYGMQTRRRVNSLWWKWGRIQWVIGVGLVPLTLTLFSSCSLVSFIANTITVPWLSFFILPLCFIATLLVAIFPQVSKFLFLIADKELSLMFYFLTSIGDWSWATWSFVMPNSFFTVIGTIIILILLLPFSVPGYFFAFFLMPPFLFFQHPRPPKNELWFTILDVGQGLAMTMQTKHHVLIYDTGGAFYSGNDMGKTVVAPYLQRQGIKKISKVIISHGDTDHIGGLVSISERFHIDEIITSYPRLKYSAPVMHCDNSVQWQWDGIKFRFLSPDKSDVYEGNNSSCVLLINVGEHTLLLPGDIEKQTEKRLMALLQQHSPVAILVAPHHGSKSSLDEGFISLLRPHYVVYSTGYQNLYHLPHPKIRESYQKGHAIELNTVDTGKITFKITATQNIAKPETYRNHPHHYWYDSS